MLVSNMIEVFMMFINVVSNKGVHDVKWTLHKKWCHWLGFAPNEVVEKPARDNATTSIVSHGFATDPPAKPLRIVEK